MILMKNKHTEWAVVKQNEVESNKSEEMKKNQGNKKKRKINTKTD